jgi:archaellum component FlaG (FlaF/FlaG flagellin family)
MVLVSGLGSGAKNWFNYFWEIPTTYKPGTYNYWARVEYNTTPWTEWKGPQAFAIKSEFAADVLSLYDPAKYTNDLTPGGFAHLWAYVKNTGSKALPSTARVYNYVTGPGGFAQWLYVSAAGLASNTGKWYGYKWNIPANQAPGTYKYWARVWDYAAGKWLGEAKCCQDFVIKAGAAADVTSLYDPIHYSDLRIGGYATLWAYVKNTGSKALPSNAKVWYYVTGPGVAKYVGNASVAGMAAGSGGWKSFKWSLSSISEGTYKYWARVWDHDAGRWLGAQKCCQSFLIPSTASILDYYPPYGSLGCGGYAYLLAKVKNESDIPFPSDARVYFWVQGPGINGYVGYYPVGGLAAGATKTWAYTRWSIPANKASGDHLYWARVYSASKGWLSVWGTPPEKFHIYCIK